MTHISEDDIRAFIDGDLINDRALEAREIEEHLEECAECLDLLTQEIFKKEQEKLLRFIYGKIMNTQDSWDLASDLAQEVWVKHLKAFKRCPEALDVVHRKRSLYTAANNRLKDHYKSQHTQKTSSLELLAPEKIPEEPAPNPLEELIEEEDNHCVRQAYRVMAERDRVNETVYREALDLKEIAEWSYPDIAAQLGKSEASIGNILKRARRRRQGLLLKFCPDRIRELCPELSWEEAEEQEAEEEADDTHQ